MSASQHPPDGSPPDVPALQGDAASVASVPSAAAAAEPSVRVAAHDVLFDADADDARCDVCGEPVVDDAPAEGFAIPGRALYVWSRGGEVRYEEPPLCPRCAVAISASALARWEIEEEEG